MADNTQADWTEVESDEFEGIELIEVPPSSGVFAGIAYVDKDLAERLLKYNSRNRPLSQGKVANIARTMRNGNWQFNGEAIKFDSDDVLNDGQHRLHAIADLDDGQCYPVLVLRGLTAESQLTMDQGAKRGAHEQLALTGADVDTTTTAAVRVSIRWSEGLIFGDQVRRGKVSTDDIIAWVDDHPEAIEAFRDYTSRGYRRLLSVPPSIALAVAYRLHNIDEDWAASFLDSLVTPVGLRRGSPVLALRSRLERIALTKEQVSERDIIAYLVMAWNHFRTGTEVAKILGPRGGSWTPETFPEPK